MIALYARQSVDREDSISTESQIEACRYEAKGETCREYIDKGFSGKNTDRPRFKELLSDVRSGEISKVIVYRLDRFSRSILDFSNIMVIFSKYQVEFISSTEKFDTSSPMGRAMLNICMVFAQLERETIQQRVTDAYYSRSEKGFYMGGRVPYGFRLTDSTLNGKKTKSYIPCEEEAAQIQLMYRLYSDSHTSYGDIITYFQNHGMTCRGKPWSRARIADHLKNPIYVRADLDIYDFFQQNGAVMESAPENFIGTNGCYYYRRRNTHSRKNADFKNNRLVLAPHEGLISSEIWLKCRAKCLQNKQIQPARKAVNTWLAGLVKCGNCKYALSCKRYTKRRTRYFICSRKLNAKACPGAGVIHADDLEALINGEIVKKLKDFPILVSREGPPRKSVREASLRIELNTVRREMEALTDKVALANETLMELINRRIKELADKQETLGKDLAECARSRTEEAPAGRIHDFLSQWGNLTPDDRRSVADSLIEVIYATSECVTIYWKI